MRHNGIFRHTCFINKPHRQSGGIIIFLCKYYIVISDKLVGSFLDVLFLLLAVILWGRHEKTRTKKDWVTGNVPGKFVWGTSIFWLHALLYMSLWSLCVAFLVYSLPLLKWCTWWMAPIKIHNIAMGGILCDDIMNERSKIWKSLKSLTD